VSSSYTERPRGRRPADGLAASRRGGGGGTPLLAQSRLLVQAWLKGPLKIGTLLPSSASLARAVAAQVPPDSSGPVIELGGGTGPLTEGLLQAGIAPSDLVVIERDPQLFRFLAERHRDVTTIEGDATNLADLLGPFGVTRARAVVSSLPIVWLPQPVQRALFEQSFAMLGSHGPFIQVTNRLRSPVPHDAFGLQGERRARIWTNLPPASVWVYRRRSP